jgi:hypothetical protein
VKASGRERNNGKDCGLVCLKAKVVSAKAPDYGPFQGVKFWGVTSSVT